ncbi:MAG TPA: hypothetical protein VK386_09940 [Acidimicrobiales bacterium]|nr:hypothetical protein [Acidimicrobiales bacterium]
MPVESDKLIYLELQKTACTTIGAILEELLDAQRIPPKHGTLRDPATTKVVVGSVRNPWDSYLSLWAFGCQGGGHFYEAVTQRDWAGARAKLPALGPMLAEVTRPVARWRRLYTEPHSAQRFRSWFLRVNAPSHCREFDPVYGSSKMSHFAGYVTYRYCRLYTSDPKTVFDSGSITELSAKVAESYLPQAMIRMEHLADDLIATLRTAGHEVDDLLEQKIRDRATTKTNMSSHGRYTDYYDEATRDLVARRDELIITRHGYSFGA